MAIASVRFSVQQKSASMLSKSLFSYSSTILEQKQRKLVVLVYWSIFIKRTGNTRGLFLKHVTKKALLLIAKTSTCCFDQFF